MTENTKTRTTVKQGTILIVDDKPANLQVLSKMLEEQGYEVRAVTSGEMALRTISVAPPDLILLDIMMPDMDGYEVCERLKENQYTSDIPVMFISALDDALDKVRAFRVGGVDYISKPFQAEEVIARVQNQLSLDRQRKEIEQLRDEDRDYYEKLNELKDDFIRTTTHDLKSPLSIIMGYADMMRDHPAVKTDKELSAFTEGIMASSNKLYRMITDLLDLARLETGSALLLAPHSLILFMQEAVHEFEQLAAEKDIELQLRLPRHDTFVMMDVHQMERVISNLVSNAIKYTAEGGRVEVSADIEDEQIIIRVKDTGYGIPAEDLPNIFKKFYRVKQPSHMNAEGTGLGLSIVQSIVSQHLGEIHVESQEGVGTTFTIILPIDQEGMQM